ncbi:hypothetical protein BO70DRAFT_377586 [Aspergillus heteromorphus CBS 117.55]|uniref:SMP-30/Gluconolactonase/LRE-like region domain-containing protein n=1 Tax=Aspergillus heteromorphus CBS 117.55 TaxID=1448321 RepID=A0A317WTM6_9EURO|nr:uncharacterized protein BO70DRAFT_377586 [Aspergillus heteromorphus CBS 117.55]PWY89161.1 hypothetical protein BO70DRAFT_377586 [Aspergillus heteromorphus CBS 117.55]
MHLPIVTPLALLATSAFAQTTQLFNFTSYVDIENGIIRPNGHLLLTTFSDGRLFTLDPLSPHPEAKLIATFPGATAITGIASIGPDKYAIAGGVRGSYHYTNETIYTIDFNTTTRDTNPNTTVQAVAHLPNAVMLNGMAALPAHPHKVLTGDSRLGCLFLTDTATGETDVAFKHEALSAPANASMPIGINGLKTFGEYVYFTNTARGTFARVRITPNGTVVGDVQVIATLNAEGDDWDDFDFGADGTAYVAQASNEIVRIGLDGSQEVVVGGGDSNVLVGPTSVHVVRGGRSAYVTTRGGTVDGVLYSGQVVEVEL